MAIVQYHLHRNLVAYKSHRKKRVSDAKKLGARESIHAKKVLELT